MPLRLSRRIRIMKGVHLNVSKHGLGLGLKAGPVSHSVGPRGRRSSIGIPGSGVSWVWWGHGRRILRARQAAPVAAAAQTPPRPKVHYRLVFKDGTFPKPINLLLGIVLAVLVLAILANLLIR